MVPQCSGEQSHCPCPLQAYPSGQLAAVHWHRPPTQLGVASGQGVQVSPFVPQAALSCVMQRPGWPGPCSQQPSGQFSALHWQTRS